MKTVLNIPVKSRQHDRPIVTDVFYKENKCRKPIVIFCHGYKGYKDWGAWNLMPKAICESNLFFVKFNFSHNGGTLQNPIDFPDLKAFSENNFTTELNDLEDLIDWILTSPNFKNEIDINNITLIGHSRGGGIASIKASENAKITKLITWAGASNFGVRFPQGEIFDLWKKNGVSFVENSRTKQQMPHLFQFYKNFKENEGRLTIEKAIKKLSIPHLIIQGELDDVILPIEAKNMHLWNPQSKLILMEAMGHTLGISHPWIEKKMPKHLSEVVHKSIDFVTNT